jgi:hypothetical protein
MVRFPFPERGLMGFRILVPALCGLVLLSCTARDTHERLNGLLWMQTSAEYEALTAVTFRQATSRVLELKKQFDSRARIASAALEQP